MKEMKFDLLGTSPLLMHNPAGMRGGPPQATRGKVIPTSEEEAEAGLYRADNGNLYIPAVGVRNSMLQGAVGTLIARRGLKAILAGLVLLYVERFPILNGNREPLTTYSDIDSRRCVVQRQGIIRSRPRIDPPWIVECSYWYDDTAYTLDESVIVETLERSGKMVGLLDYRPEKSGWFGRYAPQNFQIIDLPEELQQ
jgi:hypothetical protein